MKNVFKSDVYIILYKSMKIEFQTTMFSSWERETKKRSVITNHPSESVLTVYEVGSDEFKITFK